LEGAGVVALWQRRRGLFSEYRYFAYVRFMNQRDRDAIWFVVGMVGMLALVVCFVIGMAVVNALL
jgi:hypothetical protein